LSENRLFDPVSSLGFGLTISTGNPFEVSFSVLMKLSIGLWWTELLTLFWAGTLATTRIRTSIFAYEKDIFAHFSLQLFWFCLFLPYYDHRQLRWQYTDLYQPVTKKYSTVSEYSISMQRNNWILVGLQSRSKIRAEAWCECSKN